MQNNTNTKDNNIENLDKIRQQLAAHNQEQLLQFADELNENQLQELIAQISQLDFDQLDELINKYVLNQPKIEIPGTIESPPVYPLQPDGKLKALYEKALTLGNELISAGKVAAFTVAGGMGTRLNIKGPKGNVAVTPIRKKTLFAVFAESIAAWQKRLNCIIPWYIMTSPANHQATVSSFETNSYFGLNPKDVMFFPQGTMPSFDDSTGKILLANKHQLALSPDGHGGSLRALHRSGALQDMKTRGVEMLSYFQIDNPLVHVIDPLFVGLHALEDAQMSSRSVIKCHPLEKVGNFALVDGKVAVIEYIDLPDELAHKKLPDGRLMFEAGSIAIHMINRKFVEKLNEHGFSLPWHRAHKKVPHINPQGRLVEPTEPNAIKLETFVFDALPLADKSIILQLDRQEQFAPVKNATGTDSLESSIQLQINRAARWLEQAGVKLPRKADGTPDAIIEISPLFALDPEELKQKANIIPKITPGAKIYLGE